MAAISHRFAGVSVMVLSDTEVADNTSTPFSPAWNPAEGGGIHIESNAVAQLTRVQVLRNRANTGGGLNAYRARYEIVDSIIEGNHATGRSDGGIGEAGSRGPPHAGGAVEPSSVVVLTRTLVRNNIGITGGGVVVTGELGRPATLSIFSSVIDQPGRIRAAASISNANLNAVELADSPQHGDGRLESVWRRTAAHGVFRRHHRELDARGQYRRRLRWRHLHGRHDRPRSARLAGVQQHERFFEWRRRAVRWTEWQQHRQRR